MIHIFRRDNLCIMREHLKTSRKITLTTFFTENIRAFALFLQSFTDTYIKCSFLRHREKANFCLKSCLNVHDPQDGAALASPHHHHHMRLAKV
jgi:hypothetical protein